MRHPHISVRIPPSFHLTGLVNLMRVLECCLYRFEYTVHREHFFGELDDLMCV